MNERTPAVAIETLGCKLNQAESEQLARDFLNRGYRLAGPGEDCDVFILNTCTVTHVADRKARQMLRQAKRQNPNALVVATGCLAVRAPEQVRSLEGVDLVIGNEEKGALPATVFPLFQRERDTNSSVFQRERDTSFPLFQTGADTNLPLFQREKDTNLPLFQRGIKGDSPEPDKSAMAAPDFRNNPAWARTRAMVKIQEGCSQSCSYCIVPRVRGKGTSFSPESILEQIKGLTEQGYREIVLTGSDIGSYKNNGSNLSGLLKTILHDTRINRLRLSSLQPQEITPELLSLWPDPRLCRHVHLPLQSGSDKVLREMKRRYSVDDFRQAVARLREAAPGVAITTDVIVGFPGETTADFEQTKELCTEVGFARIHAFPYSPRPGTEAATMAAPVAPKVQNQRLAGMLALAAESSHRFQEQFLGMVFPVLWERPVKGETNLWSGLTDNYLRVFTRNPGDLRNRLLPARLVKLEEGRMWGELE